MAAVKIIQKFQRRLFAISFSLVLFANHKAAHRPAGDLVVIVIQDESDHGILTVDP